MIVFNQQTVQRTMVQELCRTGCDVHIF